MPGPDYSDYTANPLNLLTVGQALLVDWWAAKTGVPNYAPVVPTLAPRFYQMTALGAPRYEIWTYNPAPDARWSLVGFPSVSLTTLGYPPHVVAPANQIILAPSTTYTFGVTVALGSGVGSSPQAQIQVRLYSLIGQREYGPGPTPDAYAGAIGNNRVAVTFATPAGTDYIWAVQIQASNGNILSDPGLFLGTHDYGPRPPTLPEPPRGDLAPVAEPPMVPQWAYYVTQVTTGTIVGDLDLLGFAGSVSLTTGTFSATVSLAGIDTDTLRLLHEWTTPGKYAIAAVRNGRCVGEWIIWQRSRSTDAESIGIAGSEFASLLAHRVVQASSWAVVDQITVASDLITQGFAGSLTVGGAVAVVMGDNPLSAEPGISRTYVLGDGDVAAKVKELGDALHGFDLTIVPRLVIRDGIAYVERVVKLLSPRAGVDRQLVFEASGPDGPAGSVLAVAIDEDGSALASAVTVIGKAYTGAYEDGALVDAGFPFYDQTVSYALEPEDQTVVDDYAESAWQTAQSSVVPQNITVLADQGPLLGEYEIGDVVTLTVDASAIYPDGYTAQVRILDYTMKPPQAGVETVAISIVVEP